MRQKLTQSGFQKIALTGTITAILIITLVLANVPAQSAGENALPFLFDASSFADTKPSEESLSITGNPLHLFIRGTGHFHLIDNTGVSYYTRNGLFHINNQYQLEHESGLYPAGVQKLPFGAYSITVHHDGTLYAHCTDGSVKSAGTLSLAVFSRNTSRKMLSDPFALERSTPLYIAQPSRKNTGSVLQGCIANAIKPPVVLKAEKP